LAFSFSEDSTFSITDMSRAHTEDGDRFGSKADMCGAKSHVRCGPQTISMGADRFSHGHP
jgi:hypothetical protein